MTQYYSQLTAYGEKYIAKQISNGKPLNFATMAVGDGNGQNTTPTATQTTLVHEVYRANTTDVLLDEANPNQVICEFLIPENVGDFWVREVGIFDETGKLVAVANTPENYKPVLASGSGKVQYYRIVLAISNSNNLTISLNQNIVYATRTEFKQLERNLSAPDGYRLIGQCESIAQLRTIEPTENNQHILVKGYHAGSHKGGGRFVADFADNQTADNGGTVIVTAAGKRWKRTYSALSIFDYGGKVGFDVDNTEVFERIEASLTNTVIDLGGGEFYSTVKPVKNRLANGYIQYAGQDTGATNYPRDDVVGKSHLYNASSGEGHKIAELLPVTTDNNTPSYYTQGFEQDPVTGDLWSLQSGDNGVNALIKYKFAVGQTLTNQGYVVSNELSHQSFGIFYRQGERYFICQPHGSKGNQKAKYLNVFQVDESQSTWAIKNLKSIQVLPQAVDGLRALSVSPSGDEVAYLYGVDVPLTNGGKRYNWKIAVFNIDDLLANNIKPIEDFYIEKSFLSDKTTGKAVQDIAFDGSFIYVLHGGNKDNANTIAVYSRKGSKLVFDEDNKTGYKLCKQIQAKGGGLYYEAEGLFVLRNSGSPLLCMSIISGNARGATVKNTHLFALQDLNQNIVLGSQSLPAITLTADNVGIAYPNGKPLQFAEQQPDGSYVNSFKMTKNQLRLVIEDTTQPQIYIENNMKRGMFQVSSSGNLGIYDNSSNNWLIGANINGLAFCQKDWESNFKIIRDNDAESIYQTVNSKRDGSLKVARGGELGIYDHTKNKWLVYSGLDGVAKLQNSPLSNANGDEIPTAWWVTQKLKFESHHATNGWQKLPNGLILQWGRFDATNARTFNFPIAFTSTPYVVQCTDHNDNGGQVNALTTTGLTNTKFDVIIQGAIGAFSMFAIGR